MLAWTSSLAALPLLRGGLPAWKGELADRAKELAAELASAKPDEIAAAVAAEAAKRMAAFLDGLTRYRRHAYRRRPGKVPVLWRQGSTRLLDHGAGGEGLPVLVVPSLINRAYILDLAEGRSFVGFLASQGFRPVLVDWDAPGETERGFSLDDYIAGRLSEALDRVREATGKKPIVLGYCMGGLLALGLASLRKRELAGLALLATPWDFHAERPEQAMLLGALVPYLEPLLGTLAELPVDMIQALFASLDPGLALRKFLDFSRLDPDSERACQFVALEDWLNDGVPMAADAARECLAGWYGENRTGRGRWRVAGHLIDPARLDLPALAVIPHQDRIVPPASALALAKALPNVEILRPPTGHIGMMAGGRAEAEVWRPVASWLSCTAARAPLHSITRAQPGSRAQSAKAQRRKP